jgi:hypothetical protein
VNLPVLFFIHSLGIKPAYYIKSGMRVRFHLVRKKQDFIMLNPGILAGEVFLIIYEDERVRIADSWSQNFYSTSDSPDDFFKEVP